ncbi:MAG: hypothetical protein ACLRS2_08610 [[Clostridium] innocuum]
MTRWLKGIAHLSAFDAIEQIKNAKDEEEKKRLIQKEWERRKEDPANDEHDGRHWFDHKPRCHPDAFS